MKTEEIKNISKEEIDNLKESLSNIDEFDTLKDENLENLKELRKISNEDYISLGRLYFKCYKLLIEIKDYIEEKNIKQFVNSIKIDKSFEDNIEYLNSGAFGSIWKGERIKIYVSENKKDINRLIDLFFKIFGDE